MTAWKTTTVKSHFSASEILKPRLTPGVHSLGAVVPVLSTAKEHCYAIDMSAVSGIEQSGHFNIKHVLLYTIILACHAFATFDTNKDSSLLCA